MPQWLVLADDRSGALEVAGELAERIGPVRVVAHPRRPLPTGAAAAEAVAPDDATVVDLASRHLPAAEAASRAAVWSTARAAHRLHKIDSTLRGRWADELLAVQQRVLVVAALPRLGRTCVGGIVHLDGTPLQLDDARHGRVAARPADVLAAAGATDVVELTIGELDGWLHGSSAAIAICDATTDDDLDEIGRRWRASAGVVLAGTSASVAAAVAPRPATRSKVDLPRPALVAIGSLHPTARVQLDVLRAAGLDGVEVLATAPASGPVDADAADAAASALAAAVVDRLAHGDVATLIVVGGDTAAAVLGGTVHVAGGTVAPGIPWARRVDGRGPLVVTKSGGFGNPETLVDLLAGRSSEAR